MRASSFGGAPLLSKICQTIFLSTESTAVDRTSIHMCRVWPLSQAPLHRRRKLNRASKVLLLGLNPHCSSSRLSASQCERHSACWHRLSQLCSAGRWCDSCCTEKHPLFRNREQDVLLKFWGACSVRQMPRMTLYSAECTESPHASASLARCCRLAETLLFLRRLIPVTTSLWSATPW